MKTNRYETRILRNRIRCNHCGEEIESRHRHDFVMCKCGACAVDGGTDYLRRCGKREDFTELSFSVPQSNQKEVAE